jgi:hypothetical protein
MAGVGAWIVTTNLARGALARPKKSGAGGGVPRVVCLLASDFKEEKRRGRPSFILLSFTSFLYTFYLFSFVSRSSPFSPPTFLPQISSLQVYYFFCHSQGSNKCCANNTLGLDCL